MEQSEHKLYSRLDPALLAGIETINYICLVASKIVIIRSQKAH
jgi:hypothetical protein